MPYRNDDRDYRGYSGRERSHERDYDRDRGYGRGRDDDRGFFERAGDEVRSWFGSDDDDDRHRRGHGREGGRSEQDWGRAQRWSGDDSFGGGWGNQAPRPRDEDRWRRDERAERGGWFDRDGERDRGGWFGRGRDEEDRSDQRYRRGGEEGYRGARAPNSSGPDSFFGSPGFDAGFAGPRFDRADAGSTGTHGVHPVASASGAAYGGGYGASAGGFRSSARTASMMDRGDDLSEGYGRTKQQLHGGGHDPHYAEWRRRQMDELDRDYDEYRRENRSRFDEEFGAWRSKRGEQRQSMTRVREQMEVIGSDGQHIGRVDKVRGERIVLAKNDPAAGGIHHSVPCSWIERVDEKVHVNRTSEQAMREWRDEDRSRALFEREDSGSEGPHMLNRSFSGTYSDRDEG